MPNRPHYPPAHRLALIVAVMAVLSAATCLLCACGGADDSGAAAAPVSEDGPAETVVLDLDALGSMEAAALQAARAHGAPGEGERVRYQVRARSPADGAQLAALLTARGFAPVFQLADSPP